MSGLVVLVCLQALLDYQLIWVVQALLPLSDFDFQYVEMNFDVEGCCFSGFESLLVLDLFPGAFCLVFDFLVYLVEL